MGTQTDQFPYDFVTKILYPLIFAPIRTTYPVNLTLLHMVILNILCE
jgi:hypothetical protein